MARGQVPPLPVAEFVPPPDAPAGRRFAFLLVEKFSMFSLAAAIDTVRSANRLLGRDYYSWTTVSADGDPVIASNDLPIKIDYSVADLQPADILFVCVGLTTDFPGKSKVLGALRNWGRRGGKLGALSVGSHLLAEAGQLDGYRCTIHWENRAGFLERFPEVECTGNVFEIDRKRYTCAGGTTSIDLMLEIVRADFGANIANSVANQFHHERIRSAGDRQRVGPERDLSGKSEKLRKIVERMADSLDEPLTAVQLAKSVGLSVRQVERLFLRHMSMTPGRYYMRLRLERARELLRQTNMPILDIAVATGFTSHSYFAQSYRLQFGRPPSEERRTTY
jgi:transcriptional regulator GlxA family with amidase domain